jgi:uncharacterized protein
MSLEVLEQAFRRTDEYLQEQPEETVEILWHGGEPLLMGPSFFEAALDFQRSLCRDTADRIDHNIQTNLTCFDETFLQVFADLGITSIGTSYDPIPGLRGPGDPIDSDTYNARFMRAAAILDRNNIGWGLIYVVTRRSLENPVDLFYFLTNLRPDGGVNLNPVLIYDDQRKDVAISAEEYVEFLGTLFPIWWNAQERFPDVQPFRSYVETILNGKLQLGCVDSGRCTHVHINIAPNGDTSQCGRSADWGLLPYGNIRDRTFSEILGDGQRDQLAERLQILPETDCRDCRFWGLCHGGCPLDSWSQHGDFRHKSEWCEAKRGFLERHFEPLTGARYESFPPEYHPDEGTAPERSDGGSM